MGKEEVETSTALVKQGIPLTGIINYEQARTILTTIWKGAPETEVYKAAMICRDFGLHPLMKHVYLVKYATKQGDSWVTVLGIGATRLMMSRLGSFSYMDDTPRIMSEAEQIKIFGSVDKANIVAITKLRTKDGLEAPGYGKYPVSGGYLMGEDKGNSRANMAFIRSERNAFGRLFPDTANRLQGVEVADETYMETPSGNVNTETGEITEAVFEEVPPDAPQTTPEPQPAPSEDNLIPTDPPKQDKAEAKPKEEKAHPEDRVITAGELADLKAAMQEKGKSNVWLGEICNVQNKWGIKDMKTLTIYQLRKIHEELAKVK